MDPKRLTGLGFFGLAGMTYAYFPYIAQIIGYNITMLGLSGTTVAGMIYSKESNIVNRIEWVTEGENNGKLRFNISTSPFTSKDIFVDQRDAQGVFSLSNDDLGEANIENNVVRLSNFHDPETGENVLEDHFVLPAIAWRDYNTLDWVLAIKHNEIEDSTEALFSDLML